jgi:hypothetical protein
MQQSGNEYSLSPVPPGFSNDRKPGEASLALLLVILRQCIDDNGKHGNRAVPILMTLVFRLREDYVYGVQMGTS